MKLWDYLKEKMLPYAERTAFYHSGIKYKDLIDLDNDLKVGKLRLCMGDTREEQAVKILECIAERDVAVPASAEYGEKHCEYIAKMVRYSGERFQDIAFIMFTSGTTGIPKGVILTDENVITNLEYISSYFRLEGMNRICIARPLVHIAVLTGELLYALCNGLTVYFYEEAFMPQRLLGYLAANRIEVFCATPTLYQSLAQARKDRPFPVKVSALSGEILTKQTGKNIAESFPETAFYNVYGLTEHSPRVSALLPNEFAKRPDSIGRPIGGVEMKIAEGELLVRSPCVMRGYFQNETATKQKIRDGWLYTGDMAHTDLDGYFYIDGRKDDMIIRSGLNIYPEEIESAVKKCPKVKDCVAFGKRDENGVMQIWLKYEGEISPSELRKGLLHALNPHVLPNRIESADILERTPSGKKIRR